MRLQDSSDQSYLTSALRRLETLGAREALRVAIREIFPQRIALVSSFGAEAAILLHMVANIDKATPVLFLDTGKLFDETIQYRDQLVAVLGLQDVRSLRPDPTVLRRDDSSGRLCQSDPDRCCAIRKVEPLGQALNDFDAWITGRKALHGGSRKDLSFVEVDGRHVKLNPLVDWTQLDIDYYFIGNGLPRHPLVSDRYLSIGCVPCTDRVRAGEGLRDGRWRNSEKTECGIHNRPEIPAVNTGEI